MDAAALTPPSDIDAESIRLQAEEHPLIEDGPASTLSEHSLRLMHLRAYDEAVSRAAGRDVLDVGCNTGYGTMRFVPVARRVVGVDVSPRAIEVARLRSPMGHPEFVLSGGFDLPFPDATFDLVTSFQVLEHVPDPGVFLGELARVARPGGQIILATPNAATRLFPGMTPWNRFHVHEYEADELRVLLEERFPAVRILGMFGAPELYETEIRRVDAARQRIRRKQEAEARRAATEEEAARRRSTAQDRIGPVTGARRPLPIRIGRAVIPTRARRWIRSFARTPTDPRRLDARAAQRSSTATPPPALTSAASDGVEASRAPTGPVADLELEAFVRFTVDDLFYTETELDRAMDLLAICDVPSRLERDPVLHSATGPAPHEAPV